MTNTPNGNPWSKAGHNLTRQARILRENPALAAKLQSEARDLDAAAEQAEAAAATAVEKAWKTLTADSDSKRPPIPT